MKKRPRYTTHFGTASHSQTLEHIRENPTSENPSELKMLTSNILQSHKNLSDFIEKHNIKTFRRSRTSTVVLCSIPDSIAAENPRIGPNLPCVTQIVIKMEPVKAQLPILPPMIRAYKVLRKSKRLTSKSIPHVPPLAAGKVQSATGPVSVLVTPAFEDAIDLYHYTSILKKLPHSQQRKTKSAIADQIAEIFASLHGHRLRHRDAKAQNFLVVPQTDKTPLVLLLDLDGIRANPLAHRGYLTTALAKLSATLMHDSTITKTDRLRILKRILILLPEMRTQKQQLARTIARKALAFRLTTMIRSIDPKPIPER